MTVSSLWNGERSVVLLYLLRVFSSSFASPLFFHESLALLLLAFAALFIEISADASAHALHRFKTRPGASSGVLLGTVTLPSVMLSRLVQLSRALLQNGIEPEELEFLKMQYWAISASCFGVLVLLYIVMQNSSSRSSQTHAGSNAIYGLLFLAVYGLLCFMSLSSKSQSLHAGMKMMWIISHGLASASLMQHIFHTFPLCASIGEALLVAGGIVLYFGDMLALTLAKINEHTLSLKLTSFQFGIRRSEISTILQGVLFGLLLLPVVYKFVLRVWVYFTRIIKYRVQASKVMTCKGPGRSAVFYFSMVLALVIIAPMWMQFVHDFQGHPLLWIFSFVFTEPFKRLSLCIYWIFVICASVFRFYHISKNSKIERILLRKYYHLVAVIMFVPALLFQPKFIDLAFGAALALFLALEMIRVWKIWPLGELVHRFMNAFTDHRDSDILIISHFSLLLGCALPKWMSSGFNDRPLAPFAGILSLGIGDTMASMVGHKYGVLRWSKTGKKTIEGTAAGITAVLAACSFLVPVLASTSFILSQHWLSLIVAVTVSGMLEAFTAQLDNAFIPLVFYTLLCL